MNCVDDTRYLNSKDIKKMSEETITNVLAKVVVEGGYVSTGDEISLAELMETILMQNEESTADFDKEKWNSTFWSDEWLRPDRAISDMNQNFAKEYKNKEKYLSSDKSKGIDTQAKLTVAVSGVEINAEQGVKHQTAISKQNDEIRSSLNENEVGYFWTGEKFEIRPMKLYRLNLNSFKETKTIGTRSVQTREYTAVYSIPLGIDKIVAQAQNPFKSLDSVNDKIIENFEKASRKLDDKIAELKDKLSKHIESQCKNVEKRSNNIRHSVEEHKLKMQDFVEKIDAFENVWPSGRYCVFAHRDRLKPRCPEGLQLKLPTMEFQMKKCQYPKFNFMNMEEDGGKYHLNFATCCKE
ncbi:uncharacterized protein LOC142353238 [Convolutriloba macropyga]|uniref:uncharacterized protein LOC142353238 n=1 Tax=Convolutriloba macropyga TaxID=536237 RepID=UPI003F52166A